MKYYKVKDSVNIESVKYEVIQTIYINDDIYMLLRNSNNITDDFMEITKEEFDDVKETIANSPSTPEPSQLDRIESTLNLLTADTVSASAVDEAITEGVNDV